MIAHIEGKIAEKYPTHLIIDIGGLGYEVKISLNTYAEIKEAESAKLFTHFHVKEDSQTLFGFSHSSERKRFLDLVSISGVGPSTAIMILSSLSPSELQHAIVGEDVKTIQSVKGIGLKTAQRIVLELKDKMKKEGLLEKTAEIPVRSNNTLSSEALSALVTLGIPKATAEKTINLITKEYGPELSLEELIKLALKRA